MTELPLILANLRARYDSGLISRRAYIAARLRALYLAGPELLGIGAILGLVILGNCAVVALGPGL